MLVVEPMVGLKRKPRMQAGDEIVIWTGTVGAGMSSVHNVSL